MTVYGTSDVFLRNHRSGRIKGWHDAGFNEKRFKAICLEAFVVPPGIEPGTQGFSVLCSTNWAMAPKFALLFVVPICECKSSGFFYSEQILEQKSFLSVWFCCFFLNFATANRKVAQLVAHYVRDVGVGRSNRLFPTRSVAEASSAADFFLCWQWP